MKRALILLVPLLLDLSAVAAPAKVDAAEAGSTLVTLGVIDGETDDKLSSVTIRLDKKPAWTGPIEVQDHGSFLQLVLPGTLVPEPGRFYDADNPWLPKVAAYQLTPSDAGIRLFAARDAAKVKQALAVELLGNRIVVAIDNAKLKALLAAAEPTAKTDDPAKAAPAAVAAIAVTKAERDVAVAAEIDAASEAAAGGAKDKLMGPPVPDAADAVIARTEVHRDIPPPAEQVRKEGRPVGKVNLGAAGGGIDLRDKLVRVAVFSGIMLVLVLMSWALRPLIRRRRAMLAGDADAGSFTMKTLATLPLAARQKVSLIQVGDERILVGVTPEAVTFLTTVGGGGQRPARASAGSFQNALNGRAQATQQAAVDMQRIPQPVLKKLEGNDPESLREPPAAPAPAAPSRRQPSANGAPVPPKRAAGSRINIGVGEDGIKDLGPRPAAPTAAKGAPALDDVTRLIREKLKTLRTI